MPLRWKREARRAAVSLSLDKAVLQDRQNEIEARLGKKEPAWCSFSPTAYMQVFILPPMCCPVVVFSRLAFLTDEDKKKVDLPFLMTCNICLAAAV